MRPISVPPDFDSTHIGPAAVPRVIGRKENVRKENHRPLANVSVLVSSDARPLATGETVYLLTEVRDGPRIHEIGTHARVLEDHGAVVVLHLFGSEAEVVTCPRDRVARAVEREVRGRVPRATGGWLRPTTA